MAYNRKAGNSRASTFEELRSSTVETPTVQPTPSSLAARAIKASSANRDSSLSSVYGQSAISSTYRASNPQKPELRGQDVPSYEYTSMSSLNETKHGFWGVLARKAKSLLDDDNVSQKSETHERDQHKTADKMSFIQGNPSDQPVEINKKMENSPQRPSDSISSSLNYIGGTIKNAFGEGLAIVENRTAGIIHETRKLQIRRRLSDQIGQNQKMDKSALSSFPQMQTDYETQLKASRDVANAMAAKAKLLMRELKTVKAELAFAKERSAQLEEENKVLRDTLDKGCSLEDDDLIRLQLETLLTEKGRLVHENSVYARENRFLREIVEYHQLTMQDVVYFDEGAEEVTEVYPILPRSTLLTTTHDPPSSLASVVTPEDCPITPTLPSPPGAL
ncbi:hypothetical protein HPP92_000662 [Vanilla planifolia]|uniref:Uncharacterized protein n=1 Tax=Vanilla planifolia TaxID=51239 RepID=A0A835VEQ9_VANPL|nr:hypothetical protein HPP92_000778 [Vanilla planifolia]KAG0500590.1 hypothetical protein HPP92_000662 [Vanilla planifolia]